MLPRAPTVSAPKRRFIAMRAERRCVASCMRTKEPACEWDWRHRVNLRTSTHACSCLIVLLPHSPFSRPLASLSVPMPWLGFAFPGGGSSGGGTTTITKTAATSSSSSSSAASSSGAASPTRVLRAEEVSELQNENKQLRLLIQQLAEKAKQQQQTEATAAASSTASAYPSLSAASASPPATNPHAASSSSSPETVSFQKIPGLAQRMMQTTAATAPELSRKNSAVAASLSEAELAPVADFYSSLRASLSASKPTPSTMSATRPQPAAAAAVSEDEDDWGSAPSKSAPAASVDSVHAPRTEDEAVVRNKHSSVVVHKVRVAKPDMGDEGATTATAASAPAASASSVDDFDDDFGDMTLGAASTSAATPAAADGDDEEIAIFDLSNAEWWTVVPHPDREDAPPLQAAEAPPIDPQEDEDGFVVVRPKDSMAAVSDFISQMLKKHPEIDRLSPEELRAMLEGSLGELKEPGTIGKVWQMGKQAYYIYGWSSTAYSLYTDQTMLRIAAAGILKCAKWSCVFLL